MAKQTITYEEYRRVLEEAEWIADLLKMPGWKLLEKHMLEQASQIEELLTQNKLRTVEESVRIDGDHVKTFITSLESQIAENAGMYKMVKWILEDVHMILGRPAEMQQAQKERRIVVEKARTEQTPVLHPFPRAIPKPLIVLKESIFTKAKEVKDYANHQTSDGQSQKRVWREKGNQYLLRLRKLWKKIVY